VDDQVDLIRGGIIRVLVDNDMNVINILY